MGAVKEVEHISQKNISVILWEQAQKGNFAEVKNAWDYVFQQGDMRKKQQE